MALTSILTPLSYIAEGSEATPGLFNRVFSQLSDNIRAVAVGTPPTFFVGSAMSTTPSSGLVISVPSTGTDYIYFNDSSAARSNYILGSNVGGTADGLNLYDDSGKTMIASFSKQSIRFYQNVVGPVFDVGGALADTLNAATFGVASDSKESRIQAAINAASNQAITRVYIPANMYPYSGSSISFIHTVQMVREGGEYNGYDIISYGGKADGTADCQPAIKSASSGAQITNRGPVIFSGGTFSVNSSFVIPPLVALRGGGRNVSVIQRTFTGDLITSFGAYGSITDIKIDGQQSSYGTGIGIQVPTGQGSQTLTNVEISNFSALPGACLSFASGAGSGFCMFGGAAFTSVPQTFGAAIAVTGTDNQAIPRKYFGVDSQGCTLFDFGGGNDQFVYGGYTGGLLFGVDSSKVMLFGLRVAPATSRITIRGGSHRIDCNLGAPVSLGDFGQSNCTNVNITGSEVPSYDITNNGSGNKYTAYRAFTPTWTADVPTPSIGNGTLTGTYIAEGAMRFIDIRWVAGSTTSFASGQWYFALPSSTSAQIFARHIGECYINAAATGINYIGVPRIIAAQQKLSVYFNGVTNPLNPAYPVTFATGDEINIRMTYYEA